MKCPKCGYLGFETVERCRNCGYDFSLSVDVQTPSELPLRGEEVDDGPLADLDLDRVIGTPQTETSVANSSQTSDGGETDDAPLLTPPRPARPPLAVRRSTPEVPRGRSRTPRPARRDEPALALELDNTGDVAAQPSGQREVAVAPAPVIAGIIARIGAGIIDAVLLLGITVAVIYFTLAITGLTLIDLGIIPRIPMAAFLILLNGGYLVTFTAASGQTIGKMITGIRVEGDDGRRVDMAGAVLRAAGVALTLATLGLGFLPALFGARRRALHDRLAGTQVVAVR